MGSLTRALVIFVVLAVLGVAAYALTGPHHRVDEWKHRLTSSAAAPAAPPPASSRAPPASSAAAAAARSDPLLPDRPMMLDSAPRAQAGDWVTARPGFQYSHSAAERGGVEPCSTQNVDTSAFDDWTPLAQGHFSAPRADTLDAAGHFDLIIHLHGDDPVRRQLALSGQHFVLYTLTLAADQGYAPLFSSSQLFESIEHQIEQALSKHLGKPARVGHVALSAWSAGFVGVEAALAQPTSKDVDAVLLIDGLHGPRADHEAFKAQLQPFLDYAKRAAAGDRFMFVSHSSIDPPDFASTTESAHYLIAQLGGRPDAVRRNDALGLELIEAFDRADFHVRGYAGNDKADHCAQLALLRDAYAALGRRWAGKAPPASH